MRGEIKIGAMQLAISVTQIVISLLLITLVLMQSKGVGLGRAFGGGEVYHTRRGAEKIVFISTIVVATLFVLTSLVNVVAS